jgi:ABC-type transport system involved in multi-copper enzyme maturation permease subunit
MNRFLNTGLLMKSAREMWPVTLAMGLTLLVLEAALAYVLPVKFQADFADQWMKLGFVQNMMKVMLGADVSGGLGPDVLNALAWVHPVVLAVVWAHGIICCTRVPAGEIDRGTADVVLGLPVSRWQIYRAETAVWLPCGAVLIGLALAGNMLGGLGAPESSRMSLDRSLPVLANLLCLYSAVGAISLAASAASDRKGRAMTVVFIFVLASFLLNYLAQIWAPLSRASFLSLLDYYRPLTLMRTGGWPLKDMAVLAGVSAAAWVVGGCIFARRDITTS